MVTLPMPVISDNFIECVGAGLLAFLNGRPCHRDVTRLTGSCDSLPWGLSFDALRKVLGVGVGVIIYGSFVRIGWRSDYAILVTNDGLSVSLGGGDFEGPFGLEDPDVFENVVDFIEDGVGYWYWGWFDRVRWGSRYPWFLKNGWFS